MKVKHIYKAMLPTLGVLAAVNTALAVWVWVRVRRPVEYNVQVIEPPRFELPNVTNVIDAARPGLLPASARGPALVEPSPSRPSAWRHRYHYFVAGGRRAAVLNGVTIREGDPHAYGVVSRIYPERIYFEGGNYIDNESTRREYNDPDNAAAAAVP